MELHLSPQLPSFATLLFTIAGIVNSLTNSIVIYLILWKSLSMKSFRYYLLYFQLTTVVVDFYLNFLMKPIPIYPVIGCYTTGILYNVFGVSSHIQMMILIVLIGFQDVAIYIIFLRKHQTIATIGQRRKIRKLYYWGSIGFDHLYVFVAALFFHLGKISKEQQAEYIRIVKFTRSPTNALRLFKP
ncbi:hypothetical protein CRE_08867 [Caenorhabditis remanei]|uniref:G-protein coupled receptors family 1 profile domain-containing protein n=1 Tax=Caenorhabditis remanei TaxID=31234 RepID=E3LHY9_CAERE|nr:hypothetical protein CRE_08867 [Caenorhabditis remanei]